MSTSAGLGYKCDDGGVFNVGELVDMIPSSLMCVVPNEAPAKE